MKKILAALAVPGLIIGAAAIAGAQTDDDGSTTNNTDIKAESCRSGGGNRGQNMFAEALGLTGDELRDAVLSGQTIAEVAEVQGVDIGVVIADLVSEAQTRADENPDSPRAQNFDADAMAERLTAAVDGTLEPGDHQRNGRQARGRRGTGGDAIAEALGLDPSDIREALESGSTIADLAAEQGVDIDDVIGQIVAEAQARADENLDESGARNFDATKLEERLTQRVSGELDPEDRRGRGFGPQGRHGPRVGQDASGVDA